MRRFIAPVLYGMHQYEPGDVVPGDAPQELVDNWSAAGTVTDEFDPADTTVRPRAELVAGLNEDIGVSSDGDPEARAGKVRSRK